MTLGELVRRERLQRYLSQAELAELLGVSVKSISRWETDQVLPQAHYRLQLSRVFHLPADHFFEINRPAQEDSSPASLWTVPAPRNPHFTGREDLLARLEQYLAPGSAARPPEARLAALTQAQAIKGLGGIGKTQIAVEYAYRAREQGRYTHTLWINAASAETIISSFTQVARLLPSFPAQDEQDQHKLVAAIKQWLEQCQHPWLLIFDNADDLPLVQQYFPHQGQGSLLLTTRASAVGSVAAALDVENMGLVEGTTFLLHRAQRLHADDEERNEATNVVIALEGFPLALDQAGAYIEETQCSFGEYLHLYQHHRAALLARRGLQTTSYPDSVATTWSLSFQKVEQANPAAAELLRLCAFLTPDSIPEELLTGGAPHWPPLLQQAVADLLTYHQLLEALLAFSLIKRLAGDHLLSIHRLIQVVLTDTLEAEEQRQWAERVIRATNTIFPETVEASTWQRCQRYLSQAQLCSELIHRYYCGLSDAAALLQRTAAYLQEIALFEQAEMVYQQTLSLYEHTLTSEHHGRLRTLGGLARLSYFQGKYTQSEALYQQALQVHARMPLSDDAHLAEILNDLAMTCKVQGKYEQAEHLLQQALLTWEQAPGLAPPPATGARISNNLGSLYLEQGKYEQAGDFYRQAIQIWEQLFGPDSPDLARPLSNLAVCSLEQGRYTEAEPLFQHALRIWQDSLGPLHPEVAFSLHRLATIFYQQGKYEQAEEYAQHALSIREHKLGAEHNNVAETLNLLAAIASAQSRYKQAETLFQRALSLWEWTLGPDHPHVARPLNNLGNLYVKQGSYAQAEPLYRRALSIREHTLGPDHPYLAHPLTGLARCSMIQGQYEEADRLYQRALRLREHTLEPGHPDLAETRAGIAALREAQGQLQEAVSLYQQALAIHEPVLGEQHPRIQELHTAYHALLQRLAAEG